MHPDGRLQRLRIAIAHPGQVRAGWSVLAEIARRAGLDLGVQSSAIAFDQLVAAVPFYEGLTLEALGGHGVRWPERAEAVAVALTAGHEDSRELPPPGASAEPAGADSVGSADGDSVGEVDSASTGSRPDPSLAAPSPKPENGALRLGTYRSVWAAPEVEVSPALHYLIQAQQLELSPQDAARLGIAHGEAVDVTGFLMERQGDA